MKTLLLILTMTFSFHAMASQCFVSIGRDAQKLHRLLVYQIHFEHDTRKAFLSLPAADQALIENLPWMESSANTDVLDDAQMTEADRHAIEKLILAIRTDCSDVELIR